MQIIGKTSVFFLFAMTLATVQFWSTEASALSSYFTSRGCIDCHSAPTVATCAGCHEHSGTLTATKNKTTSYAPGETVTITLTASGARSGWIGARLYNQNGVEIARSTGNQSGMGASTVYPATLSAPAPATAGTYTWKMAYLGNVNGTGSGDVHSEKTVNVAITVAAPADTTAPVVSAFTLPATATSLTVPVGSFSATDNLAVTGYLINKVATAPAAGATGWTASAPASVTAVAGSNTFYAWAKDAAGNVSLAKSATVTVTLPDTTDTTKPTLTISALADGALTNKVTLNISGNASDAGGIQSVTVNGQAVIVNPDGSFSTAVSLVAGANAISVTATDKAGNQQTDSRTITSDPTAPILTIASPADNSSSMQSFISLTGNINENSTVTVTVNSGSPQAASINGDSFTATVYLEVGANTILVTATDLAGNSTDAKRTVTFESDSMMSLAVTSPNQDLTTRNSTLVLKGKVVDALSKVTVRITMAGKTYRPTVKVDGTFAQKLYFKVAKPYAITVVATDEDGNSSSVIRNVIYRPVTKDDDHDDDDSDDDDDDRDREDD
ncbi:MAG: hypothetical protein A2X84_01335 [Desulfuromonadaceae bacterium GWC2_58_13]|nr:MAG: hypothetical protein A2X84_01335 [Desulfuromonadaceae bacterium GWC2_58_13]